MDRNSKIRRIAIIVVLLLSTTVFGLGTFYTGNIVIDANGIMKVADGSPGITFDDVNDWLEIAGGIYVTDAAVIGPNSVVFQPATDSTTFLQVLDADGELPVLNIDTVNEWVGIGTAKPEYPMDVNIIRAGPLFSRIYNSRNPVAPAGFLMENIVRQWSFAAGTGGQWVVRDVTGGANVFAIEAGASGNSFYITSVGYVGFGLANPGTAIQLKNTDPYFTLQNSVNEHTEGGAESRIIGEDHLGNALGQIQFSHDGTLNDAKGDTIFSTNTGAALTEAMRIDSTQAVIIAGDTYWTGGGGLSFADIYAANVSDTITIAAALQANKVQITSFAVNGVSNNMTPDHTNDHITVDVAGMYLCTVSLAIESAAGGGSDHFGFSVYKNNGATEFTNLHGERKLAGGGGDVDSVSLSGIIDLAANDTIELWTWNIDSADDLVVDDLNLSLVQIGGT